MKIEIFTDGGALNNPGPAAIGIVIKYGNKLKTYAEKIKDSTNNQAEYQALKFGLEEAIKSNVKKLHVYMDSLLVVNQLNGIYKVKNRDLLPIYESIKELLKKFREVTIEHVPREFNKLADAEVNKALDSEL